MNTPTPRTDAAANESIVKVHKTSLQLETELTAVTEQRDSYKDRFEKLLKQYAIETHQLTEQRDRLAEYLNKMISICSCETEDIDTVNEIRYFVDTITKHSNP